MKPTFTDLNPTYQKKKKKKESNMPEKNGKVKLAVRDYTIKYKYESGTCKQIRMKE